MFGILLDYVLRKSLPVHVTLRAYYGIPPSSELYTLVIENWSHFSCINLASGIPKKKKIFKKWCSLHYSINTVTKKEHKHEALMQGVMEKHFWQALVCLSLLLIEILWSMPRRFYNYEGHYLHSKRKYCLEGHIVNNLVTKPTCLTLL